MSRSHDHQPAQIQILRRKPASRPIGVVGSLTSALLVVTALLSQRVEAAEIGVRHVLKGALQFELGDGARSALNKAKPEHARIGDDAMADIKVEIRISDHAPGVDYYGVVDTKFPAVGRGKLTPEQTIWEAAKCHADRGLPKITVMAFAGSIADGDAKVAVSAVPRHIGKLIPDDEILVSRRAPILITQGGAELAILATTKISGLALKLRLISVQCGF